MTSSLTNIRTLTHFVLSHPALNSNEQRNLSILFTHIGLASKVISNAVRRAGIEHLFGEVGITNVQGEDVKKLDLLADQAFCHALRQSEQICAACSEEDTEIMYENQNAEYVICFDPLDGSSNIDANVSIGSIFAIFRRKSPVGSKATAEDVLQHGKDMVAAGYSLYGSSAMMVISFGHGVDGFTLDNSLGEWVLTHPQMQVKKKGAIYSVNEGNATKWDEATKAYVNMMKGLGGEKPCSLRYIGSMVADVHRTLLYGGIFMYPGDSTAPSGKLRYLYEVAPLSFICEQAGGASSNGRIRALNIQPTKIHERVPCFMGSKDDVATLEAYYTKFCPN